MSATQLMTWRPIAELPVQIIDGETRSNWCLFAKHHPYGWMTWVGLLDSGTIQTGEWLGRNDDGSCFQTAKPDMFCVIRGPA